MEEFTVNADMTKVTKESMREYVRLRKLYSQMVDNHHPNKELFDLIENFIVNVINKDKEYFTKLSSYNFNNDDLKYCM